VHSMFNTLIHFHNQSLTQEKTQSRLRSNEKDLFLLHHSKFEDDQSKIVWIEWAGIDDLSKEVGGCRCPLVGVARTKFASSLDSFSTTTTTSLSADVVPDVSNAPACKNGHPVVRHTPLFVSGPSQEKYWDTTSPVLDE